MKIKYKELAHILNPQSTEDLSDTEKEHIAEILDDLLIEWGTDFEIETCQRDEIYGFLSKYDNMALLRRSSIQVDLTSSAVTPKQSLKRQTDLEAFLIEKEDLILKYDQKIEVQRTEINNCILKSKKRINRKRFNNKKARRRDSKFS